MKTEPKPSCVPEEIHRRKTERHRTVNEKNAAVPSPYLDKVLVCREVGREILEGVFAVSSSIN